MTNDDQIKLQREKLNLLGVMLDRIFSMGEMTLCDQDQRQNGQSGTKGLVLGMQPAWLNKRHIYHTCAVPV